MSNTFHQHTPSETQLPLIPPRPQFAQGDEVLTKENENAHQFEAGYVEDVLLVDGMFWVYQIKLLSVPNSAYVHEQYSQQRVLTVHRTEKQVFPPSTIFEVFPGLRFLCNAAEWRKLTGGYRNLIDSKERDLRKL